MNRKTPRSKPNPPGAKLARQAAENRIGPNPVTAAQ